ncbi:hypothetical protein GOBAR_DD35050 [Gossypium barbadense]|nr:hypothetical protein GOBAR_DD35050 [Gossypium barbadense]
MVIPFCMSPMEASVSPSTSTRKNPESAPNLIAWTHASASVANADDITEDITEEILASVVLMAEEEGSGKKGENGIES